MIEVDCQVRIKVCGLTQAENACSCADAGADWIGLNFHPASPRSITPQRGAEIAGALHDLGKGEPVALFVNRPIDEVLATLRQVGPIRMIQLHGDEPPEFLAACKAVDPAIRVIRAFRLSDQESVERMIAYLERAECLNCSPYAVLVDAHVPGLAGGTGLAIPPAILERLPRHPRLILAGGLNSFNVAERVARVRPWMVDVASGVESVPGLKDLTKVLAFVAEVRGVVATSPRKTSSGS